MSLKNYKECALKVAQMISYADSPMMNGSERDAEYKGIFKYVEGLYDGGKINGRQCLDLRADIRNCWLNWSPEDEAESFVGQQLTLEDQ